MKKIFILLLIITLIPLPAYTLDGWFDINQKDSTLLAIGTLALFIGVKTTFVLSLDEQRADRVIITALSYQTFVTLFSLVIKNNL